MKTLLVSAALVAMLSTGALARAQSLVTVHVPATAQASQVSELVGTAKHLARYLDARALDPAERVSDMWIYPTADRNVAFVSYSTKCGASPDEQHLSLFIMRGGRIVSRIVFPTTMH